MNSALPTGLLGLFAQRVCLSTRWCVFVCLRQNVRDLCVCEGEGREGEATALRFTCRSALRGSYHTSPISVTTNYRFPGPIPQPREQVIKLNQHTGLPTENNVSRE